MKSNLFAKNDLSGGRFAKDLKCAMDLDPEVLAKVPDFALRAFLADTKSEAENVYEDASKNLNVPRAQLDYAVDVARFLIREMAPEGNAFSDEPVSLAEDAREVCNLPAEKTTLLIGLMSQLKGVATEEVRLASLRRSQLSDFLPTLQAVGTTVDFRAVFARQYEYENDVASYVPQCVDMMPVGILTLSFTGDQDDVFFQVNKRSLQILLDNLVALKKKIETAEKHVVYKKDAR